MRLTKKYKEDYFVNNENKELTRLDIENDHNSSQIIRNKLGQLEDIEDELGIDLITLFKALKNGIYFKHKIQRDDIILHTKIDFFCLSIKALVNKYTDELDDYHFTNYFFKDYGKTWALTKEELE